MLVPPRAVPFLRELVGHVAVFSRKKGRHKGAPADGRGPTTSRLLDVVPIESVRHAGLHDRIFLLAERKQHETAEQQQGCADAANPGR